MTGSDGHPDCRICGGSGGFQETAPNGMIKYRRCHCALANIKRRAALIRIQKSIGPRAAQYTFDKYDTGSDPMNEQALLVARNFCDQWQQATAAGWVLGFVGEPGSGKTHLATAVATEVMWRYGATGSVVSVPQLLRAERATFRRSHSQSDELSPVAAAAGFDILVLDDLGAEYIRSRTDARSEVDWVDEQLYLLLDTRLLANRPTLYTTNLASSQMKRVLSSRVYSRLEREQVMPALEMTPVRNRARRNTAIAQSLTAPRGAR